MRSSKVSVKRSPVGRVVRAWRCCANLNAAGCPWRSSARGGKRATAPWARGRNLPGGGPRRLWRCNRFVPSNAAPSEGLVRLVAGGRYYVSYGNAKCGPPGGLPRPVDGLGVTASSLCDLRVLLPKFIPASRILLWRGRCRWSGRADSQAVRPIHAGPRGGQGSPGTFQGLGGGGVFHDRYQVIHQGCLLIEMFL